MNGWCWDIEGDALYPFCTKVWYIRLKSLDGKKTKCIHPFRMTKKEVYESFMEWVYSFEDDALVVAHNQLGYDSWVMWHLFGIKPSVGKHGKDFIQGKPMQFVDTLYMSQFYEPDLPSHSLAALSKGSSAEKMDYRQRLVDAGAMLANSPKGHEFTFYHDIMPEYCDDDVDANIGVFFRLVEKMKAAYKGEFLPKSFKIGQKNFFLMNAQSFTGVAFDIEKAKTLHQNVVSIIEEIKEEVLPKLPPRSLKKTEQAEYSMPAKPFKKNGEYSNHMLNFIEKHKGVLQENGKILFYGKEYEVVAKQILDVKLPMELKDQAAFKGWLMEEGWSPTTYNVQKDSNGRAIRDPVTRKLISTSPKLQENGKLCPNLEAMDNPLIKDVVKYLSYKNRIGVLEGWLSDDRLEWDGRLSAGSSGITSTHRQKHVRVCNVPRCGSLLGEEMRSLFTVEDGMVLVGVDSAALENRVTASYTFKYDGGKYADIILNGDSHSYNAKTWFPYETREFDPSSPDHDKDHPDFKKWRSKAKNGLYCILYGGQAEKLAQTLGVPKSKGALAFTVFWNAWPALKAFKEAIETYWRVVGKSEFLPAIDGRILKTRSPHSLINQLCQSAGAIATDTALLYFDNKMGGLEIDSKGRPHYMYKGNIVKRVLYQHDEVQIETTPEIAEEIGEIVVDCIKKAGKYLKFKVELDGEFKIAENWMGTH